MPVGPVTSASWVSHAMISLGSERCQLSLSHPLYSPSRTEVHETLIWPVALTFHTHLGISLLSIHTDGASDGAQYHFGANWPLIGFSIL